MEYLREYKPTVAETVELAGDDPDVARRIAQRRGSAGS